VSFSEAVARLLAKSPSTLKPTPIPSSTNLNKRGKRSVGEFFGSGRPATHKIPFDAETCVDSFFD